MGWNSWDSYGTTIRENQVKANADWMAQHLAKYGWQYIVVDIQWYEPNAQGHDYKPGAPLTMDEYGRLMPAVNRFPSSANGAGFKSLADYVHSKGLKFGIHIMRGIPRQAVEKNLPIKGTPYHAADVIPTCGAWTQLSPARRPIMIPSRTSMPRGASISSRPMTWAAICTNPRK